MQHILPKCECYFRFLLQLHEIVNMFYHSGVEWFLLLEVKYVKIILYIMYYYISYLCLCLLIILGWYKTVKKKLKTLLTSVDLMYSQTSVSCHLDPRLFCGLNWPVIANKVIIHFTCFVPSLSKKTQVHSLPNNLSHVLAIIVDYNGNAN